MEEIWKDVVGFEKYYQVSSFGRVRSKDRIVKCKSGGCSIQKSKVLKPCTINTGYLSIGLIGENGSRKKFTIHRLVAINFIDNTNNLPIVYHKDGSKQNNYIDNLVWGTQHDNLKNAYKKEVNIEKLKNRIHGGGMPSIMKKLTKEDVENIQTRKNNGEKRLKVYENYKHLMSITTFYHLWNEKYTITV